MLREESALESTDLGIVLNQPAHGTGYQVAGALQRLGRRMIGMTLPDSDPQKLRDTPMQTFTADWERDPGAVKKITAPFASAVLTLEPELSTGELPSDARLNTLESMARELVALQPNVRLIFVLPESTPPVRLIRFSSLSPRSTVFTSPVVFGFRDGALLDRALHFHREKPGVLSLGDQLKPWDALRLVFVGDVASFVTAAYSRSDSEGKVIAIPPNLVGLSEFLSLFNQTFPSKPAFFERLATRLSNERLSDAVSPDPAPRAVASATAEPRVELATDVFPNPATSAKRVFEQLKRLTQREPFLELVFPPTRAI